MHSSTNGLCEEQVVASAMPIASVVKVTGIRTTLPGAIVFSRRRYLVAPL
jgi:hypothetical protein